MAAPHARASDGSGSEVQAGRGRCSDSGRGALRSAWRRDGSEVRYEELLRLSAVLHAQRAAAGRFRGLARYGPAAVATGPRCAKLSEPPRCAGKKTPFPGLPSVRPTRSELSKRHRLSGGVDAAKALHSTVNAVDSVPERARRGCRTHQRVERRSSTTGAEPEPEPESESEPESEPAGRRTRSRSRSRIGAGAGAGAGATPTSTSAAAAAAAAADNHSHSASPTQCQQQAAIGKHAPRPQCTRRRAAETSRGTSAARTSPCPAAARRSHSLSPVAQQPSVDRFQTPVPQPAGGEEHRSPHG